MMWGDLRVDIWFYAIVLVDLLATFLFFVRGNKWKGVYLSMLASPALWVIYESKITEYLSASVPIRLDFPIVALLAFYPVVPSIVYGKRMRRESSQKRQVEQAGTGQPATSPESKSEGRDKPQPESEGRSR